MLLSVLPPFSDCSTCTSVILPLSALTTIGSSGRTLVPPSSGVIVTWACAASGSSLAKSPSLVLHADAVIMTAAAVAASSAASDRRGKRELTSGVLQVVGWRARSRSWQGGCHRESAAEAGRPL